MSLDDRQWAAIGATLEHCWPDTAYTGQTEKAYRAALHAFETTVVAHAIENIVSRGVPRDAHPMDRKRRPSAPEIAEECRIVLRIDQADRFDAPAFVEIERVVCNEAWERDKAKGSAIVRRKCGDHVADWFDTAGRTLIRSLALGDDAGGFKVKQVAASYREFVSAKQDRVSRQLPTTTRPELTQ